MKIISGCAANIELAVPPGEVVRPTLARTRKALFDHLGELTGSTVLDLCAGAGSLGLEAASRGAAKVVAVEIDPAHLKIIHSNWEKVRKTGCDSDFRVISGNVLNVAAYAGIAGKVDLVLADPPYPQSAELFATLLNDPRFAELISGARLVWEMPDTPGAVGQFMAAAGEREYLFRKFGVTTFYLENPR